MRTKLLLGAAIHAAVVVMAVAAPADWYAVWDRAGNTWHEKWTNSLNRVEELPKDVRMELLGRAASIDLKGANSDQRVEIARRAQSVLLAMPSHAEYYRARIVDARDEWEEAPERLRNTLFYDAVQPSWVGFGVLKHLPSAETVRALGSLLDDERGRYIPDPARPLPGEAEGHAKYVGQSNCERAVTTLAALPLVAKPVTVPSENAYDNVPAWRQWYREIAEGRRTFRFEGDPVEYDLDGPASAEKLKRTRTLREREGDRAARAAQRQAEPPALPAAVPARDAAAPPAPEPASAPSAATAGPPLAVLLIAAAILLAALVWNLLRRAKARSARR